MSSSTLQDPPYGEQLAFAASVKDTVLQQFREYARHIIVSVLIPYTLGGLDFVDAACPKDEPLVLSIAPLW
jgi:hypothetical protein